MSSAGSHKNHANSSARPTILIIDDDENITKNIYQVLLEQRGYRVLTASNGQSGIDILRTEINPPGLVLVDCSMPLMDGETFLVKLKEELPLIFFKTKIVGFTSFDPRSLVFQKIQRLAFDCREKPSSISGIVQLAADYLEGNGSDDIANVS